MQTERVSLAMKGPEPVGRSKGLIYDKQVRSFHVASQSRTRLRVHSSVVYDSGTPRYPRLIPTR